MNLLIVIPTYNEKDNIRPLTEKIHNILPAAGVLIVDDNSPDGTGEIADVLAKENSLIRVIHGGKKRGLGKAYIAGFKEALKIKPDYIVQMDADFSHDPAYIPEFLEEIKNCDVVIGSRFLDKAKKKVNVTMLSVWANRYVHWILGLKVSDSLGGFKCFRCGVLEEIDLDKFIAKGFIFQTEFVYRALRKGFRVREIPIIFQRRKTGETKITKEIILEAFLKTILLRIAFASKFRNLP